MVKGRNAQLRRTMEGDQIEPGSRHERLTPYCVPRRVGAVAVYWASVSGVCCAEMVSSGLRKVSVACWVFSCRA